jgi:hypothetical protein
VNGTLNGSTSTAATTTTSVAPVTDFGGGVVGGGGSFGGGNAAIGGSSVTIAPPAPAASATPLLDQVTRTETAKQARRRAEGREPRVIGIAPRTDVDRTDQMPDDPIIRY